MCLSTLVSRWTFLLVPIFRISKISKQYLSNSWDLHISLIKNFYCFSHCFLSFLVALVICMLLLLLLQLPFSAASDCFKFSLVEALLVWQSPVAVVVVAVRAVVAARTIRVTHVLKCFVPVPAHCSLQQHDREPQTQTQTATTDRETDGRIRRSRRMLTRLAGRSLVLASSASSALESF